MTPRPIIIVQGAQWGSEAKGAIAAYLCESRNVTYAVRTGAINAGHTVYYKGQEYKMQQLPVGWVNPETQLVIGPGAMVHVETLMKEIQMIDRAMDNDDRNTVLRRLWIDHKAGLHTDDHTGRATLANRHHSIGATGKGCSEALIDRVRRRGDPEYGLLKDTLTGKVGLSANMIDVPNMLNRAYDEGELILLEGTQGSHLDLLLGPYPYTTHKPCNAAQWVVEAGLSPALEYEVVLVARTYPIRVAGNSGPMPREIDWTDLARTMNARLHDKGKPPLVPHIALDAFQAACEKAAEHYGAPHWKISMWTAEQRNEHREAASEMHRYALNYLQRVDHPSYLGLRRLFETTTVTKKLRRVAEFDIATLRQAVMWNRPTSIALTFANYWYPDLWNHEPDNFGTETEIDPSHQDSLERLNSDIKRIEQMLDTPISMVSFGPESKHVAEYNPVFEGTGPLL